MKDKQSFNNFKSVGKLPTGKTNTIAMETNIIYNGNSLDELKKLPSCTIDSCITSPPYWGLRDYGHDEQIGNEKHFTDFVNNLCDIFDEVKRVLKDTGTCFVNLGDTYGTQSGGMAGGSIEPKYGHKETREYKQPNVNMHKSLCMIPERFAIEMVNRGWTLRNQIIWHKPNQMPSSAKDRFTVDFEKIFFFVKEPIGYYFEQQIEDLKGDVKDKERQNRTGNSTQKYVQIHGGKPSSGGVGYSENGRNMRTVWDVNTEPNTEAHFATYPEKLVKRMLKAGCPENGTVLDPFFGSGTTGLCARKTNRNYVGIELNPEYVTIATNRIFNEIGLFG